MTNPYGNGSIVILLSLSCFCPLGCSTANQKNVNSSRKTSPQHSAPALLRGQADSLRDTDGRTFPSSENNRGAPHNANQRANPITVGVFSCPLSRKTLPLPLRKKIDRRHRAPAGRAKASASLRSVHWPTGNVSGVAHGNEERAGVANWRTVLTCPGAAPKRTLTAAYSPINSKGAIPVDSPLQHERQL